MSEPATIVTLHNRMSEAEYERERAELRATYGDNRQQAGNRYEQELALLFAKTNWTQEELAVKEGKSQSWIARRLLFGRFLNFMPTGINPESIPVDLSERRFRGYWDAADSFGGNERMRFAAVAKAIRETPQETPGVAKPRPPKEVGKAVVARFANGKWHTPETIAAAIDASADEVERVLESIRVSETRGCRAEKRKHGKGFQYRIFKQDRTVSTGELRTKLSPLIESLKEEGGKSAARIVPSEVARIAVLLERLIDEWEQ